MQKRISTGRIYIAESRILTAGRGVFAGVSMKKGELIETCPVIEIPEHESAGINESILVTYIYYLGKKKDRMTIVLGYGSLYNHSDTPNATYRDRRSGEAVDFIASRDIARDEEITVDYSPDRTELSDPLWFTAE
jgi:SET domain-containing protein